MDHNSQWFDPARESQVHGVDQLRAADARLLGRETYEFFSSVWPKQTDAGHGFAERINRILKHVASRTLSDPLDENAQLIEADLAGTVAELKRASVGNQLSYGCGSPTPRRGGAGRRDPVLDSPGAVG